MIAQQWPTLESMHRSTGLLLQSGQRLLCAVVILGVSFCMLSVIIFKLVKQPEAYLHTQGFMLNYAEMSKMESTPLWLTQDKPKLAAQPKDPNWDGSLAGASVGFNLGQNIPFIGPVCGPVLGAIIGYKLDSRI